MVIRPEVMRFAERMEIVLRKHDHKGGWRDCGNAFLLDKLYEEYQEVDGMYRFDKGFAVDVTATFDSDEFVDLANVAMMLWDTNTQGEA